MFYDIGLVGIQQIGAKMGLPLARVRAWGVAGNFGVRRRLSRFLRRYRARPKKAGQFPPREDWGLSVYAHVRGRYVLLGLFMVRGGEQSHFFLGISRKTEKSGTVPAAGRIVVYRSMPMSVVDMFSQVFLYWTAGNSPIFSWVYRRRLKKVTDFSACFTI